MRAPECERYLRFSKLRSHFVSSSLSLIAALIFSGPLPAQTPDPSGLWKTVSDRTGQADGLVRIVEINGEFRGTVVAVFSPPADSPNPVCELCEGELKGQPVIGMTILRGLRREGERYTGGEILDPDDGKVYRCTVTVIEGGKKLDVRGYIGIPLFGRSQVWQRME
jgi:uncharacterized protein (DUF2147 family)